MLTDEDIERKASAFRRQLGGEAQPYPDLMTVIQKIKSAQKSFNYLRVPDRDMPDAEAQWDSDAQRMSMRESVFQAMQRGEPRARMTIAHELGHFVLGHSGVRNRATAQNAAEKYLSNVRREEREAKRFAAAFLAPAELISADDTADEIARRFGLSSEAAEIRRSEVEAMRLRESRQTRKLPANVLDYLREAKRRGFEVRTELD